MMHGIVDLNCEPTLRLVVGDATSRREVIDALLCAYIDVKQERWGMVVIAFLMCTVAW